MSNDIENTENNNASVLPQSFSHKNKSCEKLCLSISDARDLVSNLSDISLFMGSGVLESDDEIFDMLLARLQDKIENLESCLSFIVNSPFEESFELIKEALTLNN